LFPFPKNTGNVLKKFKKILIPEGNMGQLSKLIKSEYLLETISLCKVKGAPLNAIEIENKIEQILKN
jgi:2-oxoglutarate ferredoxin oxidoreductase subunit alpha